MSMNIDEHLDEVLGIIQKPKREIKKIEKVKPMLHTTLFRMTCPREAKKKSETKFFLEITIV